MKLDTHVPVVIGAALFSAGIYVNYQDKNTQSATLLALFTLPSLMFLSYLSEKHLDIIAYILLIIPAIIIYIGYKEGIDYKGGSTYTMY